MIPVKIPEELNQLKYPFDKFASRFFREFAPNRENYFYITAGLLTCLSVGKKMDNQPLIYEHLPPKLQKDDLSDMFYPFRPVIKSVEDFSTDAIRNTLLENKKDFGEVTDVQVNAIATGLLRDLAFSRARDAFYWIEKTLLELNDDGLKEHYLQFAEKIWKQVPLSGNGGLFLRFLNSVKGVNRRNALPFFERMIADSYAKEHNLEDVLEWHYNGLKEYI
jgi:hypothetical protein